MRIQPNDSLRDLIYKIPKTDLHCHLDGSIRIETILDIAQKEKIFLPSDSVAGLNTLLFKDNYNNLEEYLKTFGYSTAVLQTPENLERIAYELGQDAQDEGVRYLEVRFAPQLHINHYMDMEQVLVSVNKGLEKAKNEFNTKPEIQEHNEPPFAYGIIVCALRSFGPFSEYYKQFIDTLSFSDPKTVFSLCSLELAKGAVYIRDKLGIPIVAFDLAGAEKGNPAKDHWEAFQFVHANFMAKTVHAGEAYGAPSIFQAITELHAERLGHGYYLFDEDKIDDPNIVDKKAYIHNLVQHIADRRISIEVCLTSNMQTNPAIGEVKNHAFKEMLKNRLSATFCTDNRTVSKTTVTKEILLGIENFNLSPHRLKNLIIYGFKRSFYFGSYMEKRKYVRQCIDFYESLVKGTDLEA